MHKTAGLREVFKEYNTTNEKLQTMSSLSRKNTSLFHLVIIAFFAFARGSSTFKEWYNSFKKREIRYLDEEMV